MVHFGKFLKTWNFRSNSVTRQVILNGTKIGEKCQNWKIENVTFWVIFKHCGPEWFSNTDFSEALEGQELLEAMEPEYVDDKDKREGTFDSVFLGNRG